MLTLVTACLYFRLSTGLLVEYAQTNWFGSKVISWLVLICIDDMSCVNSYSGSATILSCTSMNIVVC